MYSTLNRRRVACAATSISGFDAFIDLRSLLALDTKLQGGHCPRILAGRELWNAAHARLAAFRPAYLRATNGQLHGRPNAGLDSKYLLTGLATCGAPA